MQFDDFLGVLTLLKDADKYEEKVQELIAREQAIQDSLASFNLGKDLVAIQKVTNDKLAEAEDILAKAKEDAAVIVENARHVYDQQFARLQEAQVVADQAVADLNGFKSQQAVREEALRKSEKELEKAQAILDSKTAQLVIKQAEVDDRLAKLRGVMG